jgi:Carboxypeptidase regulatory-like domain
MLYRNRLFGLLLLGGLLVAFSGTLQAQSTSGTVLGTVKDASGAVIPGAKVTVTNTDEGSSRVTTTDSSGNYTVVDAKPGHYSVMVSKAGFQSSQITGLLLTARQTLRADASLRVGEITQSVTVSGRALGVITTDTATISANYQNLQINNLPTNYRASANGNSPYYLLTILPGVQPDQNGNVSIQGGLQSQSQFTVDGISTTDNTGNYPLRNAFPSAEALAEMRVQGVGAPAEYGDPADITTISKSGTNQYHGSLFWYHQNAALDAIPFGASSKPKKVANDFGGSLGGPVVLPHLYNGHDKTFFFADFEGFRFPRTGVVQNSVPTDAMRNGDLSNLCTAGFTGGVCNDPTQQIYDPTTGQPFLNNQVPSGMISPIAQGILKLYPLPNVKTAFTNDNYNVNVPANLNSNGFDVRGDQNFGSKLAVFARYTHKNINQLSPQELLFPSSSDYENVRMLVASATYTLKPTMLNEFRFGITNNVSGSSNPFDGKAFSSALGLQGVSNLWWNGVTEVNFSGLTTSENVDRLNSASQSKTFEFLDDLTWVRGHHTLKFGVDMRKIRAITPLGFFGADNYGTFYFNGMFSGNDFADFLLGYPNESDVDNVTQDNNGNTHQWALYAQDSFRVSPRLTLDYGLRWEYHPGYTDASGNIANFNDHVPRSGQVLYPDGFASILSPPFLQSFDACPNSAIPSTAGDPATMNGAPCTPVVTASQAGYPQGLRTTSKRFMPRFGFAYTPFHNGKTVVRGSIGAYEAATMGNVYYSLTGTAQAFTRQFLNSQAASGPAFAWPETGTGGAGFGAPQYGTAYFGTANQVNWKEPYAVQWGLSVERNLGFGTGLRISYIGMKTTNLVWAPNWNQSLPSTTPYQLQPLSSRPYPNWGTVNSRDIGATAYYNALEAEATHRFGAGLTFDSTYTFSRNLADNQGPSSNGGFCGETACNRSGDFYNRNLEYGNTYGPRHRWLTTVIYQLPFGGGQRFAKSSNRIVNAFIGGWRMSNIFEVQSGPFLTPYFSGADPSGTGIGLEGRNQLPDHVGSVTPGNPNASEWFLASGYRCPGGNCQAGTSAANPPIGRFGTASVGSLQGPGTIDWDLGLSKSFRLTEHSTLRIEASFVNVLNRVNLAAPDMKITDTNNPAQGLCGFGCITAAQGLYEFAGAREGQIGARIDF